MMQYKHRQGLSCYSFPIRLHYLFISNNDDKINHQNKENLSKFITCQSMFSNTDSRKNTAWLKTASVNSCITVLGSCQVIFVASFIHIFLLCFHDSHFHFLLSVVISFSSDVALMIF